MRRPIKKSVFGEYDLNALLKIVIDLAVTRTECFQTHRSL
jgi:hypothetical protein